MEALRKHDLPDRLGSMLVKEMRQNLRRSSFVYPFLGLHLLAVMAVVIEFQSGANHPFSDWVGMFNLNVLIHSGPLWLVTALICGVIMPLGGLILMGQELDEGNHELLLLTRLSRWKVVRGKFVSLWSLCLLALVSLVPYVMVRYQMGGVELTRDLACLLSVAGGSGVMCAGAVGASSFGNLAARIAIMLLFLGSALGSGAIAIIAAGAVTESAGIAWHLNALATAVCFVLMGLGLARSRLRLSVRAYEVKPTYLVVGLLSFTAFAVGMTTAMTAGYAGFVGLIGMGLVAIYSDPTPKAPAWVVPPPPNIPGSGGPNAPPSTVQPPSLPR